MTIGNEVLSAKVLAHAPSVHCHSVRLAGEHTLALELRVVCARSRM